MRKKVEGKRSATSTGAPAKGQEGMVRTTVWLPQKMHQRLKEIGGTGGASEEIRRRLEISLTENPKTRDLIEAISFLDEKVERVFGDWSEDPFAFEVLKASVDVWLMAHRPEGEAVIKPNPNRDPLGSSFGPDSTPENIARFYLAVLAALNREER